jgi:hypothetical protein
LSSATRLTECTGDLTYVLTDFSYSMEYTDYKPTRKEGAILAVKEFLETKARCYPQDLVGLIAFDNGAHVLHYHVPVALNASNLSQALRNPVELDDPGTNFTAALLLAERCLKGEGESDLAHSITGFLTSLFLEPTPMRTDPVPIDSKIIKRLIMLSDGEHNGGGSPEKVSRRIKKAGVIIECIGIAGRREKVDEKMLKVISSKDDQGNPRYSFIGNTRQLIRKYESMAHHIQAI